MCGDEYGISSDIVEMTSESGVSYMMVQISVIVAFKLESNVCVREVVK